MDYDFTGVGTSILIDDGWYPVLITDITIKTSSKGNEMWVITTEEPLSGSVDKTYAPTKKPKNWVLLSLLKACGFKKDPETKLYKDVTPDVCIGMTVEAQNKTEENNFIRRNGEEVKEMRNKFVLFRPATEKATL